MSVGTNANLLVNGSFELFDQTKAVNNGSWWGVRSLQGWTLEGTQKDGTNWFEVINSGLRGVVSDRGSRWLDMDASSGNIAISQSVANVEAGKQYTLSLRLASSGSGDGVDIYWGGIKLANVVPTSTTMDTVSFTVTGNADAAKNMLRLVGTGVADGIGVSIDEVSLTKNAAGFAPTDAPNFYISGIHEGTTDTQYFEMGAGSGRNFINNFDVTEDRVRIRSDLATSWGDLKSKAAIYQSGASTVVEFYNDSEVLVFTQFNLANLKPSFFQFDAKPGVDAAVTGVNLIKNGSFENIAAPVSTISIPTVSSLLGTTSAVTVTSLLPAANVGTTMSWGVGALSIDGWSLAGTPKSGTNWFELSNSGQRGVAASDGSYWLDMDASAGNIAISQAVNGIQSGKYYTLSFMAASSQTGNGMDVFWGGEKIGTVSPTSATMQKFSFVVEGGTSAASNLLEFKGTGTANNIGVSLDNVQLFAHATPSKAADIFNFGLGSGTTYVTDFQIGLDKIVVKPDLFTSYEQLVERAGIYQDGKSTIIEFHNGVDILVLPQFDMKNLTAEMFSFTKLSKPVEQGLAKVLNGTAKDDILIAGAGDQTIDGGAGFDVLTGGVGADTFVYNAKSGHDFIVDFKAGQDHILMSADVAKSFEHLLEIGVIYQDGSSTQLEIGEGQMITFYNTDAKTVSADWFLFS